MCQKLLKSHRKFFNLKILKDFFFAAVMLNQPRTILQFSSCHRNSECCLCSFPVSHKDQKILKDADKQHVQISGDTSSTQLARIVTVLSRKGSPSHNENIQLQTQKLPQPDQANNIWLGVFAHSLRTLRAVSCLRCFVHACITLHYVLFLLLIQKSSDHQIRKICSIFSCWLLQFARFHKTIKGEADTICDDGVSDLNQIIFQPPIVHKKVGIFVAKCPSV